MDSLGKHRREAAALRFPPAWCLTSASHRLAGDCSEGTMSVCSQKGRPATTGPEDTARKSGLLEEARELPTWSKRAA